MYFWLMYRAVGLSKDEEIQLKNFIVSKEKKIVSLTTSSDTPDITQVAELHMHRLLKLFLSLATQTSTGLVITKASWETANSSLPEEERAISALLFQGADLDHNNCLSFDEFAKLAVLKSAAEHGDADSQLELIFELIDTDGDGTISPAECLKFVSTCVRAGKLRAGDGGPRAVEALAGRLFSAADLDKNGAVTRDEFRRTIGPALYRDVWRSGAPAAAGALAGSSPDYATIAAEYRQLKARQQSSDRRSSPEQVRLGSDAAGALAAVMTNAHVPMAHPPPMPRVA